MPMEKIKPLIPTLRERKRYLSFEIISDYDFDFSIVKKHIFDEYKRLYGENGLSKAGLIMLSNKYDKAKKRGIIRVSNKELDKLKLSLAVITKINDKDVIFRTLIASGMIKKATDAINT